MENIQRRWTSFTRTVCMLRENLNHPTRHESVKLFFDRKDSSRHPHVRNMHNTDAYRMVATTTRSCRDEIRIERFFHNGLALMG